MDLSGFNLNSDFPQDRLVFKHSDTRNVPAYDFSVFTIPNTIGYSFIPFIRYSVDGGDTWNENGVAEIVYSPLHAMYVDRVSMTVKCNQDTITVYVSNGPQVASGTLYEIHGIDKDA